jgi:hypothetical protein
MCDCISNTYKEYRDCRTYWEVYLICSKCHKVLRIWTEPKGDDEY